MEAQQQANIFRMSATLFANNNYQISPVQLHRRIVEEALFVMNDEEGATVGALSDYIEREYFYSFDENELQKVLRNQKYKDIFEWHSGAGVDTRYTLTRERREILNQRKTKTLNDFIEEYLELNKIPDSNADVIYQYLYGVFTTNVGSFRRMLEVKNVKELTTHFTPEEKDIDVINGFLDWDNEQKNIAIFNLASYALEFCLLTSKKDSSLKLDTLKHKTFYLDTNILYRAVGINGEDRKLRTLSFLRKLKESENKIKISRVTWEEYDGSLKSYIKRLRRSETPAIQSKVYTEYVTYDDLYRFYHLWASNRSNPTIDLFVDWMNASIKSLIDDYGIEINNDVPYSVDKQKDRLGEMAAQIRGFGKGKFYDTALNDACNITWVEFCRKPDEKTLFSTKTFLISSDYGLYIWDAKYHSKETPIVVLPSQWLSLLLRYVARSKDDYRSFVCFLNIQDKEGILSPEQINAILVGISEMTDSVEQQRYFLETIIEREFKDGAGGKTNDQLRVIARNESEKLLQKQVDALEVAHRELEDSFNGVQKQFEEHKEETLKQMNEKDQQINDANERIGQLTSSIKGLNEELNKTKTDASVDLDEKDKRIRLLEEELATEKGNHKRFRHIVWKSIGVILLVALIIWFFSSTNNSSTVMGRFLSWIESLNTTQQSVARIGLGLVLSAVLIPLICSLLKDCFPDSKA